MKKVKTTKKVTRKANVKITPKVKPDSGINYASLKAGACFMMRGALWQKSSGYSQRAQNLSNGTILTNLCGTYVQPVLIDITWKEK